MPNQTPTTPDAAQAAALLAALEAAHGPEVLAALVGAAWRKDETNNHAAAVEEDGEEEAGTLEDWLFEAETEAGGWVSEIANCDGFHRGRGCPGF